jgi:hypothetical protein
MLIIGCDFHTRYQQIAMANDETGELLLERRLDHESGEALAFYRSLQGPVRVGIEATGPIHWFERLLAELGHELWIPVRRLRSWVTDFIRMSESVKGWRRQPIISLHASRQSAKVRQGAACFGL